MQAAILGLGTALPLHAYDQTAARAVMRLAAR
jgi:hypothetical protein